MSERLLEVSDTRVNPRMKTFARVLKGFTRLSRRYQRQEASENAARAARFKPLLAGFRNEIDRWQKSQEATAREFNLFDVLGVAGDEVRHSMLLAWLLDSRPEKEGTHFQGNLGLRLFLETLPLPASYARERYWVRREQAGDASRVDVEVAATGKFVIHIENKLHAAEGVDQTTREWGDLVKRARSLNVPPGGIHAYFLTMDGAKATNPKFESLDWRTVAGVFERFANDAKPPEVKLAAAHCARALRQACAQTSREERSSYHDEESV